MKKLLPKQPLSVLTSLAYIAAGVFVHNIAISIAFYVLAVGSGWYHWTGTKFGEHLDVASMFLVLFFIGFPHSWELGLIFSGLLFVYYQFRYHFFKNISQHQYIGSFGVITGLAMMTFIARFQVNAAHAIAGLLILLVALFIRAKSINKQGVSTDKLHSLWHLLSAFGLFLLN